MKLDFIQIGANIGNPDDFIGLKLQNHSINCGIFIEPNPKCFNILKNKFNNNNFFIEQIAIKSYCGKTILYIDNFDIPDHYSQIASTKDGFIEDHPWGPGSKLGKVEVSCETIENLWKRYNLEHVKYLCVDTEGSDFEILVNTDFSNLNIDTIAFEHMHTDGVHQTGPNYELLKEHLKKFGYNSVSVNGGDTVVKKN